MDEQLEYGFTTAVFVLDHVAEKVDPAEAGRSFSAVTRENFWRMWPTVREWAEAVWAGINEDLADRAVPATEDEFDETGGGG